MLDTSTEPTVSAFRAAAERRDLEALLATLAPDVVIRSPVSARLRFQGIEDARELFGMVFGELGEFTYTDELADADTRILVYKGRLAGQEIEETQLLRLAPDGRIREICFFIRPLPGLAGVGGRFAPALARRRHGPFRTFVMWVAGWTLRFLVSFGDRVGSRLLG
jgi:ketosteroid isomerase-like protein